MSAATRVAPTVEELDSALGHDIECECMVCHLPPGTLHAPVEWKLTWCFPGPYPAPGTDVMLMCDECHQDWIDHPEELGGYPVSSQRV